MDFITQSNQCLDREKAIALLVSLVAFVTLILKRNGVAFTTL
jgi:hypothetical protein